MNLIVEGNLYHVLGFHLWPSCVHFALYLVAKDFWVTSNNLAKTLPWWWNPFWCRMLLMKQRRWLKLLVPIYKTKQWRNKFISLPKPLAAAEARSLQHCFNDNQGDHRCTLAFQRKAKKPRPPWSTHKAQLFWEYSRDERKRQQWRQRPVRRYGKRRTSDNDRKRWAQEKEKNNGL